MDIVITSFRNRQSSVGKVEHLTWASLVERLRTPIVTDETLAEYRSLPNEKRTEIKDVGGFVGGELDGGKRSKVTLRNRTVLTIDADDAKPDDVETFACLYDTVYCVHTTHTSTDDHPRLRWLFPLSRPVTADEYRLLVAEVKSWVGADTVDESTDQPERLMFWPSVCKDSEYHFWVGGAEILDPDTIIDAVLPDKEVPPAPAIETKSEVLEIPEGSRNKQVFYYASVIRGVGLDKDGLLEAVSAYNYRYCNPPLPEFEINTIVNSVMRYAPGEKIPMSLRDGNDDFGDIAEEKVEKPKKLESESLASLCSRDIKPPDFIINGFLPVGLGALIAPPKTGKSWYCLDLAISVAKGTEFLGFDTNRHGVLYLALEDSESRIKSRSLKVAGNEPIPDTCLIVRDAPSLSDDLLNLIEQELREGPDIRLVIIDTLQKIRGVAKKNEGVYSYDYRELGEIQKFALNHDIAILLVHHSNKGKDDADYMNNASGSNGVTGALDFAYYLSKKKRGDQDAKLDVTGRDVMDKTYVLRMNWFTYRWDMLGEEKEVRESENESEYNNDPIVKTVRYNLDEMQDMVEENSQTEEVTWRVTASDLVKEVQRLYKTEELTAAWLGRRLKQLLPMMERIDGIRYEFVRTNSKREHVFTREIF